MEKYPVTFINRNLNIMDEYFPWTEGLWSLFVKKIYRNAIEDMSLIIKVHHKSDDRPIANTYIKWANIIIPLCVGMRNEESIKVIGTEVLEVNRKKIIRKKSLVTNIDYIY